MKLLTVPLAGFAILAAPAVYARDAAVEAPIQAMMTPFDRGDFAALRAEHAGAPTIVDNVAPFRWKGYGRYRSRGRPKQ